MAEATRRMAERAGCITLPPVGQYLHLRDVSGDTVRTLVARSATHGGKGRWLSPLGSRTVSTAAAGIVTLAGKTARLLRRTNRADEPLTLSEVSVCDDDDIARLFAAMRASGAAMFERSPEAWHWRFHQVPDLAYRFIEARRAGVIVGIGVYRAPLACELPVGTLADWLVDPADKDVLAALATDIAERLNCYEAVVAGASTAFAHEALTAAGFLRVKTHHPVISSPDPALLAILAQFTGAWHLTKADHDWDQVHTAP